MDMFVDLFVGDFVVALHLLTLGSCYAVHINALSIPRAGRFGR